MAGEKFIGESVTPVFETPDGGSAAVAGAPVVPGAFIWRGTVYPVLRVLESGRELGLCTHGSGERYVRKHWYRVASTGGVVLRLYFERRPRSRGARARRWWLYSTASAEVAAVAGGRDSREQQ